MQVRNPPRYRYAAMAAGPEAGSGRVGAAVAEAAGPGGGVRLARRPGWGGLIREALIRGRLVRREELQSGAGW